MTLLQFLRGLPYGASGDPAPAVSSVEVHETKTSLHLHFAALARLALLLYAALYSLHAQPTQNVNLVPDCIITLNLTTAFSAPGNGSGASSGGPGLDNRNVGCTLWYANYSVSGFSTVTVTLQTAPNASGAPGTWATFANQSIVTGSNPSTITNTPPAATYVSLNGYGAWVRVLLSSVTGSGIVTGAVYGWRQ